MNNRGLGIERYMEQRRCPYDKIFISVSYTHLDVYKRQVFDQIMALTKGGPAQSTESISFLIYNNGMAGGQFGFQSANAVVFFVVIVVISVLPVSYTHLNIDN